MRLKIDMRKKYNWRRRRLLDASFLVFMNDLFNRPMRDLSKTTGDNLMTKARSRDWEESGVTVGSMKGNFKTI